MLLSESGGTPTAIANSDTSEFSSFYSAAINNEGTIVSCAVLDEGGTAVVKVAGDITRIVDSSGAFRRIDAVSLNSKNAVAFFAYLDSGPYGIFTGADPVADKIIQTGDPLFGSTVEQISSNSKALNDAGEVAFWAKLADGREVIARGAPAGGR